jgi:hypothetical protein
VRAGATAKTDGCSSYTGAPGVTDDPHIAQLAANLAPSRSPQA